jgi:hypothetical protein
VTKEKGFFEHRGQGNNLIADEIFCLKPVFQKREGKKEFCQKMENSIFKYFVFISTIS